MQPQPTVGIIIHCWPERHDAHQHGEEPDESKKLVCAGLVTDVQADKICVHYFLPPGWNGQCEFPLEPATEPTRGKWWWPPRA